MRLRSAYPEQLSDTIPLIIASDSRVRDVPQFREYSVHVLKETDMADDGDLKQLHTDGREVHVQPLWIYRISYIPAEPGPECVPAHRADGMVVCWREQRNG
jgi:hypothetical protein